jgi:HD superfamily phosphohydrolase
LPVLSYICIYDPILTRGVVVAEDMTRSCSGMYWEVYQSETTRYNNDQVWENNGSK